MKKIAILMTCYNRSALTVKCIESLYLMGDIFDIYLVDDGSTDGTSDILKKLFPAIILIRSEGDLFWAKGMNLAWRFAAYNSYDYYLWVNDDTIFNQNALIEILSCSDFFGNKAVISGLIADHESGRVIYGGTDFNGKLIKANGYSSPINHLNGNFVLIPKYVFEKLGFFSNYFHHDLADVDYGLRAQSKNIPVYSTKQIIGYGYKNEICRVRLYGTNLVSRYRRLYSPLGSPPKITFKFRLTHLGLLNAIAYYIFIHYLNILPDIIVDKFYANRYK